jgi:hypothetical protein
MDLYIGGYFPQTLSAKGAEQYFARLLRGHARSLRPTVSQKWPFAFSTTSPAVKNVHPLLNINRWPLDYDAASQAGTVVPQHISFSGTSTGARHPANVSLNMPIFFVHDDHATLGLPLLTAVEGDREALLGGRDTAPVGFGSTICLRINVMFSLSITARLLEIVLLKASSFQWPGYSEWNLQIKTREQNATSNTISLEKFAKRVADGVGKFLDVSPPPPFLGVILISAGSAAFGGKIQTGGSALQGSPKRMSSL